MAYSYIRYTGDGSTTQYTFNFTLGYLTRDDVYAFVDDVSVPFTWINDGIIDLVTPPVSGAAVLIRRIVDKEELIHDYNDGAVIVEKNLDDSNMQSIMAVHEMLDGFVDTKINETLDMNFNKIVNLLNPVDVLDAANKQYVDSFINVNVPMDVYEIHSLTSGQTEVVFSNDIIKSAFYLNGDDCDNGRLVEGVDYAADAVAKKITLTQSYPSGTRIILAGLTEVGTTVTGVRSVVDLADLRSNTGSIDYPTCILQEEGRGGAFNWDSSNLSTEVAADTQSGIYVAPTSDLTGASGAWVRQYEGAVNVKWFGAVDGMDSTVAISAAMKLGDVFIPQGTFIVTSNLSISSPVSITAMGNAIIKRGDNSDVTALIYSTADVSIDGLEIDGNRDNNTIGGSNIIIASGCLVSSITNCVIHSAKESSGYGDGVAYSTSTVNTNQSHMLQSNIIRDNDGNNVDGISVYGLMIQSNSILRSGQGGVVLNNFDMTFAKKLTYCTVIDNIVLYSGGTGILVANYISDNDLSSPTYTYTNTEASRIIVSNNIVKGSNNYGIAASGLYVLVSNNVVNDNGTTTVFGGVLFNTQHSILSNNSITANYHYGVDAGGCYFSLIEGNSISNNGVATDGVGLNLGATIGVVVTNNRLYNNGDPSIGRQLTAGRIDTSAEQVAFESECIRLEIKNNTFSLTGTQLGIHITDNAQAVTIIGNGFSLATCTAATARLCISVLSDSYVVKDNYLASSTTVPIPIVSGVLNIPEVMDYVLATGGGTITDLQTSSMQRVKDGVAWLNRTAKGSGYTSQPTVAFSGGGGSGAAATAHINNDGEVLGFRMTNYGSGYTSAPTVTITGGGGSGATATAQWKVPLNNNRAVTIHTASGTVINRSANPNVIDPSGANISSPTNGFVTLASQYSQWYTKSKNF